ncbi:MAG: flagellin [Lachnospiraceae bacterium]|nr:flagellin [Lachnospiraceae bacterium]
MVVQHNLTAMNSNRMLNLTTSAQAKSTQKLSSGYKINTAADDAAGLSISEKMRRQMRGLSQASANAEDGISCVQTAEGTLSEVTDMIQRMSELSVKGENGTLTSSDRLDIAKEVSQLMSEIDRVQSTTTFNNQNLLTGEFTGKALQVGAEANQHIDISISNMNMTTLATKASAVGGSTTYGKFSGITTTSAETEAPTSTEFASLNKLAKSMLSTVSAQRSSLGAVQNRLEHTINNLDNIAENTTAAESAIRDTDMATQMVSYSNNNILSQAGTAMLAQANQSNQNVLSLLG